MFLSGTNNLLQKSKLRHKHSNHVENLEKNLNVLLQYLSGFYPTTSESCVLRSVKASQAGDPGFNSCCPHNPRDWWHNPATGRQGY